MIYLNAIDKATSRDREHSLQAIFTTRYAWLLRWALHFTENDRAAAEDLVQETFVRLLLTWDTLYDLDDLEPLLYSYLRYAHLSERRRGRSHAFQRLSTVDFDTLAISLRHSSTFDPIDVQNEIRQILAFLLWRRRSARFASMFLLRFFHGYFPDEIALICGAKRFGVDLGLRQARQELKAHLSGSRQIRVLGRSPMPEYKPLNVAIPMDALEQELRKNMFSSADGECLTTAEFERCYDSSNQRSLESDVLAHIVTCESCLSQASARCGTPPPSSRSLDESFGRAPKGKKPVASDKQRLARVFTEGQSRMREIYEHRPTGLVIALNAQVTAVRDINSAHAVLKVETHAVQALELIEVFSEQGLLLIALPVLHRPPKSQPEIQHAVELSCDRTLSLVVRFTQDAALIETTYLDPHFDIDLATADVIGKENSFPDAGELNYSNVAGTTSRISPRERNRHRLLDGLLLRLRTISMLVPLSAAVVVIGLLIVSVAGNRQEQRIEVNQALRAAVREQDRLSAMDQPQVIHQRIRIQDAGHTVERNLYRDAQRKRRPRQQPMDAEEQVLRARLAEAQVNWDDPLSAQSYRDWHDHQYGEEERVGKATPGLLTITTMASQGAVAQETLTVKMDDYHTVARTVRFRDGENIEIAELSYDVIPWGPSVEPWFEPILGAFSSATHHAPGKMWPSPAALTDEQLDVAELNTMLALQEMQADTERLEIERRRNGIAVKGIVASDERKNEIAVRLRAIPHVTPEISSYRDLEQKSTGAGKVSTIQQVSVSAGNTPLTNECEQRRMTADECRQLSYALLNASAILVRESRRLADLRREYPATKPLTAAARQLLLEIAQTHFEHMDASLAEQERVMRTLGTDVSTMEREPPAAISLNDTAQQNLSLCKELLYTSDEHSRPAGAILQELAVTAGELRVSLPQTAADFGARSDLSSNQSSPRQ